MSAQTLRAEKDDRNIAPTVGTGGSLGGPTGLFTVYDGQTLRRGEFTFSAAYSNFDRDPGNVDIIEVPVSFQIGVSDHLEFFFNTDAYRQVKVNSVHKIFQVFIFRIQALTELAPLQSFTPTEQTPEALFTVRLEPSLSANILIRVVRAET